MIYTKYQPAYPIKPTGKMNQNIDDFQILNQNNKHTNISHPNAKNGIPIQIIKLITVLFSRDTNLSLS